MLSLKDPDKARRYLYLLDEARCAGNWEEVSCLRLKVAKHVPQRQCLHITVATDYMLSTQFSKRPLTSPSLTPLEYGQRVPELVTALQHGNPTEEDTFHAEVCLAWLHWTINKPSLALSQLPPNLVQTSNHLASKGDELAGWTHVCVVKGAFLRGICQENAGNLEEAVQTYESLLPYISNAQSSFGRTAEHCRWTQRLLARHCMLSSRYAKSKAHQPKELHTTSSLIAPTVLLAPFRAWADFWEAQGDRNAGTLQDSGDRGDIPRREVWQAYYETFSIVLQTESTYPSLSATHDPSGKQSPCYETEFFSKPKLLQCAELRRVEAIYEELLLNELNFPKANEATPEIEAWVDQVISNWKVVCGPTWMDEDHPEGGKENTSRKVLAILYRAATRSFHSTRILRHLFTVHMSLADFGLAGKALDTYFDIVIKGKARVHKSGQEEPNLDDDATVILTAAAGLNMLCLYGRRKEAERANELAIILEAWLQPHHDILFSQKELDDKTSTNRLVRVEALVAGFTALGISQAHWASLTYETSARSNLYAQAIRSLRSAVTPGLWHEENIEVLYNLALVLSKTRDLDGAIVVVKRALAHNVVDSTRRESTAADETMLENFPDVQKRGILLRSWHLLALLLSAKQKFSTALASCDAALELFGIQSPSAGCLQNRFLISKLDIFDKESILEIKMTQLALTEVIDGPEEAVNSSSQLLALYGRLFDYSKHLGPREQELASKSPPASRHGTIKSFRGSLFSRSRNTTAKPPTTSSGRRNAGSGSNDSSGSPNTFPTAPAISVTSEGTQGSQTKPDHTYRFLHHESNRLHKRNTKKSAPTETRSQPSSLKKGSATNGKSQPSHTVPFQQGHDGEASPATLEYSISFEDDGLSGQVGVAISHDLPGISPAHPGTQTFSPATQALQSNPTAQSRLNQVSSNYPPTQILSPYLPSPPLPTFPLHVQTRRALCLLTKIWLLIASLYRRANMPTDAQGALSEATSHVSAIEASVASTISSSAAAFSIPDYGCRKSVAELWADVKTEKGRLCLALKDRDGAEETFESSLIWWQEHPGAIVSLANMLLDVYVEPLSPPQSAGTTISPPYLSLSNSILATIPTPPPSISSLTTNLPTSILLPRLSGRDRAYGLLSSLTKSGAGWDCSEAWFALARAYEARGQAERAKEALWWVVELEETRGIRGWGCLGVLGGEG